MERVLRDLQVHSILEGTNEIMRVIIDRNSTSCTHPPDPPRVSGTTREARLGTCI